MGRRQTPTAPHREGVWSLVTAAEMRALDLQTIQGRIEGRIEGRGIPGEILMESAGRALVAPVLSLRAESARWEQPVLALCGAGNNGGDGFVAVRHLLAEGITAEAVLVGDPDRLPNDAAANWRRLVDLGSPRAACRRVGPDDAGFDWAELFDRTSVVVDALFGTGLQRPIAAGMARLIESLNTARGRGLRVVAVDLPSGIAADTGQVLGAAVLADRTVTI